VQFVTIFGVFKVITTIESWEEWVRFGTRSKIKFQCSWTETDDCGNETEHSNFVIRETEKFREYYQGKGSSARTDYVPTGYTFEI
jgi:hypothetical protein